jgi:PAS domain S-box-containing protein/putative nucleotidyltransferase with HDIG domain
MNREEITYLVPYVLSLLFSTGILIYTWRHQNVRGGLTFSWAIAAQAFSIFGFIFEMISRELEIKIVWDKFEWFMQAAFIISYFSFVLQFTEHRLQNPRLTWGIIFTVPVIFLTLVLTDGAHQLIYSAPQLIYSYPFLELKYDFTFVIYLYSIYIYSATLFGIWLLLRRAFQTYNSHRTQYLVVAAGFFIPIALSILSLFDLRITPERDNTPFAFALGNFIVSLGLFRYRLFDIVPIAREKVIENINDPVVVLDLQNRIVDINAAALQFLKTTSENVLGVSSREVFKKWPEIVVLLDDPKERRTEISVMTDDGMSFYDVNISSILSKDDPPIGYIVVAHDITRQKVLETSYRILSEELEKRVKDRTEQLRETASRYQAVVENQTEFIVRWKPDGTRTFVNEAYCRYFGTTAKQALSTKFMPLIVEEDRKVVENKIERLISGNIKVETDVHRVYKPDGKIGWQEWTDQVIFDPNGQIVEIQSVGRDITDRKLAEEEILDQVAFDEIMTRILARFATSNYDEVDESIEVSLAEIAKHTGTDYVEIFLLADDKVSWKVTHKWSQYISENQEFDHSIRSGTLPWSEQKIINGEVIRLNTLDDYPPEAAIDRQYSESNGAKSLISIPIIGKEQFVFGCLDLISYTRQITWKDSDVTHLKILGDVIANTLERKKAEVDLVVAYDTTLEGWAQTIELKDKETEGHSRRVTETTLALAEAIGIPHEEMEHIHRGAILHDIGKLAVPDHILKKEGPLTVEEREIISKHPETAYNLLKQIPYLTKALEIPYCHHEKWDGSGYPRGLKGEEIPLAARVFAIVDVWDALTSDRPYRKAWERERALQYIKDEAGKHFDPKISNVFLMLVEQGRI